MSKLLRFKGLTINKEDFEEKYDMVLTDIEWNSLVSLATKSWEDGIDELRLMVFRHIKSAINEIGYKPVFENNVIKFRKE